jgi:hypothetical protein
VNPVMQALYAKASIKWVLPLCKTLHNGNYVSYRVM